MQVDIKQFRKTKVAVLEHCGPVEKLNESVSIFIEWRKTSQLSPLKTCDTFGLAYSDPKTTIPEKFRFDICGSIETDVPANPQGVITKIIPGGRCAVLRHFGSHEAMGDKIHYLYADWLPKSGEKLRDFPCMFHYLTLFPEVAENELITDIYVPLT